jgi:hypothetical protein
MTSIPCVQADHNSFGCDTDRHVPEDHLLRAIKGGETSRFRFQEANRLSGMADLVRDRLRDRLLGRQTDLLLVELTPVMHHRYERRAVTADRAGPLRGPASAPVWPWRTIGTAARSPGARMSDVASIIEPPRDELFLDLCLNQLEPHFSASRAIPEVFNLFL